MLNPSNHRMVLNSCNLLISFSCSYYSEATTTYAAPSYAAPSYNYETTTYAAPSYAPSYTVC